MLRSGGAAGLGSPAKQLKDEVAGAKLSYALYEIQELEAHSVRNVLSSAFQATSLAILCFLLIASVPFAQPLLEARVLHQSVRGAHQRLQILLPAQPAAVEAQQRQP